MKEILFPLDLCAALTAYSTSPRRSRPRKLYQCLKIYRKARDLAQKGIKNPRHFLQTKDKQTLEVAHEIIKANRERLAELQRHFRTGASKALPEEVAACLERYKVEPANPDKLTSTETDTILRRIGRGFKKVDAAHETCEHALTAPPPESDIPDVVAVALSHLVE